MRLIKYIILCFLILFLISGCTKEDMEEGVVEEIGEEVGEDEAPEFVSYVVVRLTEQKTMDPSELHIAKGDVVKWVNADKSFNHNLVVYSAEIERPTTKDIIVKSGNIAPGDNWDYTFEEAGEYIVRDIYSGTMRGEITAEVVAEISEGEEVGTVNVS